MGDRNNHANKNILAVFFNFAKFISETICISYFEPSKKL